MLGRKPEMKHRRYRCQVCGKEDRKGRLIGHVLKYHIPMDRVPFSCSLCNFRCTDKKTLVNHLNSYQRHKDEVLRSGVTNLASVLNRAENPVNAEAMILPVLLGTDLPDLDFGDIDSSIFDPQDPEVPVLPDWLATSDMPTPPGQLHTPNQNSNRGFLSVQKSLTLPAVISTPVNAVKSPFLMKPQNCASSATVVASTQSTLSLASWTQGFAASATSSQHITPPVLTFDTQLSLPACNKLPSNYVTASSTTSILPSFVQSTTLLPTLPNLAQAPAVIEPATFPQNSTPDHRITVSSAKNTPLQDEAVYVLSDLLDGSYTSDPLFQEGRRLGSSPPKEKPTTSCSTSSQTVKTPPSDDKLNNILMAIHSNGRELHAVNRNLRSVLEELRNIHGAFASLERTCARRNNYDRPPPLPARSRSPNNRKHNSSAEKENMKSVVKKVKRN